MLYTENKNMINTNTRSFKGKSLLDIKTENYTIIDLETTGLDTEFDEIIELGALKVRNNQIIAKYQQLIKPDYEIDEFISKKTGITNEMLKSASNINEKLHEYLDFIGDDIIIGHNVNFDINFLYDNSLKIFGRPILSNNYIDTLRIGRRCIKDTENHRLSTLAVKYNIDTNGVHRALKDCQITYELFNIEKEICAKNPDCLIIKKSNHAGNHTYINAKDIVINIDSNDIDDNNPFYNKEVVFTGKLDKLQRKEAMQIIANLGGINSDSITKRTEYLILGNTDYCANMKGAKTNKMLNAEKKILKGQNIAIISENVFYDMISDNCYENTKLITQ